MDKDKSKYEAPRRKTRARAKNNALGARINRELHWSDDLYFKIFDSMTSGVAIYSSNDGESFKFLYLNPAGQMLSKVLLKNIIGKDVREIFPGITSMGLYDVFRRVWRTGKPEMLPMTFYKDDRLGEWVENRVFKISDREIVAVYDDISERKRVEEELRESEKLYHSLFENMLNGFAYCKMIFKRGQPQDFIYLDVNKAFESLTGLKNVVGKKVTEVIPGIRESDPELFEIYGRVALTGKPERFETYVEALEMWFSISVYSPEKEHFVAVFDVITERKRVEKQLRKSEAILNETQSIAKVGGWEFDTVTGQGTWTAETARIHELDPNQETSAGIGLSFYHGESRRNIEAALKEAIKSGKPFDLELELITAKGNHKWVRTIGNPVKKGNKVVKVRGSIQDITELKKAEEGLRSSEERFRELAELLPQTVFEMDLQGRLTFVNRIAYKMLGYTNADFERGMNALDMVIPEQRNVARAHIERSLAEGLLKAEYIALRKDGTSFPVIVHTDRIQREGKIFGLRGIVVDIAEQKLAEIELRKLSLAVEQSPVSVMITDLDGNIEYVNPKFAEVTGYTLEEVRGKNPRFLKSGETPAEEYRKLWETITSGGEWRGEFQNRKKDGSHYWERASISSIRDSTGSITHFFAVKEDITSQKALEDQLLQAQKMESIGQLAGGVAHDFNNMLSVIIGNADLALMKEDKSSPQAKSLQEILAAAQRSASLTSQLLAFARKQTVSPRVLDLNDTIANMLKMLRRLIGEDIELIWKPGPDLWPVKVDPAQIDQVLANLAVNARDAIAGVGKLSIETENVVVDQAYAQTRMGFIPGEYVMLAVSDTGTGMDKQVLEHIFEPFFTTKSVGKGTGLGLSTVYGIVKQNNGLINVYSEPDHGTTFRIYLPRTESMDEVKTTVSEEKPLRGTQTILLVEDEESILNLGKVILTEFGYTVLTAQTPGEAVNLAERHKGPLHLLIADVVMPEMNGRELEEKISALRPGIKTLFMSGYTADVIAHQGVLEAGIKFLEKPFSLRTLAEKVREALED